MSFATNYKDDMFTGSRKYRMIDNNDGTYSFEDVTDYLQRGNFYGAAEVNAVNGAINDLYDFSGKQLATQTLSAGATSLTFTDSSITATSTIRVFTDKYLVSPISITTGTGTCTLTFVAQSSAMGVYLIVRNYNVE